ncbi:MAG: hypothetical protein D6717_00360 [Gammaproteobacteria bacterium]|nr:MAG: hypothetical protein D6717_00360 [Gammaproteobacteria bacterium]
MSWRDNMRRGSIRGVPFSVQTQELEGGRRVARHEYPGRDKPWAEDLGRRARTQTLEIFVLGPDYMAARDALLAALEQPGPADLVHPWLGAMTIQIESYRLRESTRDGGMASFTLIFTEAGARQYPAASRDTQSLVRSSADALDAANAADFTARWQTDGQPGFVVEDAAGLISRAADAVRALAGRWPGVPTALTSLYSRITDLQGAANELARSPADTANGIIDIVNGLAEIFDDPLPALELYGELHAFGDDVPVVGGATPARMVQASNQQALTDLVRVSSVAAEARAATTVGFETSGQALAERDRIAERVAALAAGAADPVRDALLDLHVAARMDLAERAAALPRLATFTPAETMPSLVLAHEIYGDARREPELSARNRFRHPGFVPGGEPVEYLS